ncbi:MAG TPA: D-alanyl-D-alanine carboxypeptidase family protein [Blastocatellia bacterium]|nr:D-alanyl-D-alanine carboxypeptidase family protein [Blastocatellia bacterium]
MLSSKLLLKSSVPLRRQSLFLLLICLSVSVTAFSRTSRAARCNCSNPRLAALDPVARKRLDAAMRDLRRQGLRPRLTTTFRSHSEQRGIYRCYHKRGCRARRGIYRAARPGTSMHEAGLAVDVAGVAAGGRRHRRMTRDGRKIVRIMQKHGFRWPHGMRDPVHFEISPRQAGYRTQRAAIRAGQQRWASTQASRRRGQRVTGRKHHPHNRFRLERAVYQPSPTRR